MSREELIEKFSGYHRTEPEECGYVASGGHAACYCDIPAEIERLLAAEREKMREMCAKAAEGDGRIENMAQMYGRQKAVYAIRQLDLTKLDEGSQEKG